jgi:hypothetical protein
MARQSERLYVARSGTSATNTTAVALSAATAKTVVGVIGSANDTISLVRVKVSFPGVTTTDVPAIVEVGLITAAGTSTAFTPVQWNGPTLASSCTAGYNHTVEPTYSRILDSFYMPILMGTSYEWNPLGEEPLAQVSQGFAVRITSPSATSALVSLMYAE